MDGDVCRGTKNKNLLSSNFPDEARVTVSHFKPEKRQLVPYDMSINA